MKWDFSEALNITFLLVLPYFLGKFPRHETDSALDLFILLGTLDGLEICTSKHINGRTALFYQNIK